MPAQPNQSLIDGIAVLQALASSTEPVGSRELARRLSLEPTRANRLLGTLAHIGLAVQEPDRRYRPGPGIHVLAAHAMYGSGLLRRAMPAMESLRLFAMTTALGVLWAESVAYLYHASPTTRPGEGFGRAALYPAHHSGVGMALLAEGSDEEARERLAPCLSPQELAAVLAQLPQVRQQGYAKVDQPGNQQGLGLALGGASHVAIAFSGRIESADHEARLVAALREAARSITASA